MKKTTICCMLLFSMFAGGCTKDVDTPTDSQPSPPDVIVEEFTPMTFDQTRVHVSEALGSDAAERIEPTSRYVRVFFPNVDRLIEEIRKEGLIYSPVPAPGIEITPVTVQEGQPEPVYTVLAGDAQLPDDAEYEVLAEFFSPGDPQSGLTSDEAAIVEMDMKSATRTMTRAATTWKPWGRIQYKDELTGEYYPMAGVKIYLFGYQSNYQMIQEYVYTDADGNFQATKEYVSGVTEAIQWERASWSIMSTESQLAGTSAGAALIEKAWNKVISASNSQSNHAHDYATAFLAAKYMHENGYTLSNGTFNSSVKICCLDEAVSIGKDDSFSQEGSSIMKVSVYCQDKTPLEIMQAVCRETGKAVQRLKINRNTNDYRAFSRVVTESWGEFTKFYFLEKYYGELGALNYLHSYNYVSAYGKTVASPDALNQQDWYYDSRYSPENQCRTPMFIDIYDDLNQLFWPNKPTGATIKYPDDAFYLPDLNKFSYYEQWSRTGHTPDEIYDQIMNTIQAENIPMTRAGIELLSAVFPVYQELHEAL